MIRVNVLYPNNAGSTFDMAYYLSKHMPMVQEKLGAALKAMTVDEGLTGGQPGTPAAFRVITTLSFDSAQAFQHAFLPVAADIQGDIPRFTNIVPVIQVSDVRI
jgi:uncharacterized protein (TIGR02118 family)